MLLLLLCFVVVIDFVRLDKKNNIYTMQILFDLLDLSYKLSVFYEGINLFDLLWCKLCCKLALS